MLRNLKIIWVTVQTEKMKLHKIARYDRLVGRNRRDLTIG